MNAHLSKPIDVMELYATLMRFFPQRDVGLKRRKRLKGQSPQSSGLPLLPGIDIAAVLDRVDGNVGLLKKILEGFAAEKRTIVSEIGSALGKSEWPEAERLAHGLKGVAGNLSAGSLAETAAKIEKACINRSMGEALDLLIQLEIQVAELISSIELFTSAPFPTPAGKLRGDIKYEQVAPAIQELVHLLRLQDLDASVHCRRLCELLGSEELQRQALAIEKLVSRLDFRGALSLLDLLAKSLDMTLEEA
jgi:HPt (histidine-containing phosphotransfer) domain-containing protein